MKKCLICEKDINAAIIGGTLWQAKGNYGSSLFDPDPGQVSGNAQYLEAVVCDPCLKEKKELVEEVTVTMKQTVERKEPAF